MTENVELTNTFDRLRPKLIGLAYRMLGSYAEAEDAVQDTWVKWLGADSSGIENHDAWLTAVCSRRCIDLLKSAHKKRVDYVGAWLPEPIVTDGQWSDGPSAEQALSESLTMAFLLALERLTPKERVAFLLHDIFDTSYQEVASILELKEPACRKLVSRARQHVSREKVRHTVEPEKQAELMAEFQRAIFDGELAGLSAMLASDVNFHADGGGKVPALLRPLHGIEAVMEFVGTRLPRFWQGYRWEIVPVNGALGALLKKGDAIEAVLAFGFDEDGKVADIFVVRNPDKIRQLEQSLHH